jgi:hypothetical protein
MGSHAGSADIAGFFDLPTTAAKSKSTHFYTSADMDKIILFFEKSSLA